MEFDSRTNTAARYLESLKLLRTPKPSGCGLDPQLLAHFYAAGLVRFIDDHHVLTRAGRRALLSGSPKLWDVAA